VNPARIELALAVVIACVLLGLAVFGWRQWLTLHARARQPELSPEDRHYFQAQANRRLIISAIMLVLAVLLAGIYLSGQGLPLTPPGGASAAPARPDEESTRSRNAQYSLLWIIFSLLLLGLVILAFIDMRAIRRYGLRHYRQIQADRRDMLEREVARLRSERNGH
jgi:hypothetical protein